MNKVTVESVDKIVKYWLILGVVLVLGQVVIGGVTRLTGSGLSITKWDIVTGTLPPLSEQEWVDEWDLYKTTPQYAKINQGMELQAFKFIYFWEYFHRLWARSMGFIFLFPFIYFKWKKKIPSWLNFRLIVVVLMAMVVASFGWIMVKSGLVDRPWVNAYKLTLHLSLAAVLFFYLLWTVFLTFDTQVPRLSSASLRSFQNWFFCIASVQFILGGLMSGMKAGLLFPTWPDMNGVLVPDVIFQWDQWTVNNLTLYDQNLFTPALVQLFHRSIAYGIVVLVLIYFFKYRNIDTSKFYKNSHFLLLGMVFIQVLLGILTLISCKGSIPVGLGVLHQGCGLLLLSAILFHRFLTRRMA